MVFVRFASQTLFIKCDEEQVKKFLIDKMHGTEKNYDNAVEVGDEFSTIVFLKDKEDIDYTIKNKNVLFVERDVKFIMKELINWDSRNVISRLDMAPSMILLRYIENWENIYKEIQEKYEAKRVSLLDAMKMDGENCTIIALTQKPLYVSISPVELVNPPIVIDMPPEKLFKDLQNDVLIYLTKSTENLDWYELNITVYSKNGDYKWQHERIIHTLNELGTGLILHESWTLDHPFVLVTIAVYQITMLSLFDPISVKKILLGMEYDKGGNRMVDLDLYYRKGKISWTEKDIKKYGKNRLEVGMYFRKELIKKLPKITVEKYFN